MYQLCTNQPGYRLNDIKQIRESYKLYYERGDYFMLTEKLIKVIGLVATVIGVGATLTTSWVGDKKIDATIEKKVAEALAKRIE